MPNFDQTGPAGKGAKTGAQIGKCENTNSTDKPLDGRGMGKGQGRGRGAGRNGNSGRGQGRGRGFFGRFFKSNE